MKPIVEFESTDDLLRLMPEKVINVAERAGGESTGRSLLSCSGHRRLPRGAALPTDMGSGMLTARL